MIVRKLLAKGFSREQVSETLEISLDEIKRLARH